MEFICYSHINETENTNDPQPRVCVVGEFKGRTLKLAVSMCSLEDRFVRKEGRELARKRLKEGKHIMEYKTDKVDSAIFHDLADFLIYNVRKTSIVEPTTIKG